MFEILNLLYLGGVMVAQIVLYSDGDYPFPENRETVVSVSSHREWWRSDSNCKYTGVMVPFARDWDQVNQLGKREVVLPAEPNKTAGQALIINRKVCGDKVEPVFRVSEIWAANSTLMHNHKFVSIDATDMNRERIPKWLGQVLRRIERVAEHDEKAKAFLTDIKSSSLKMSDDLSAVVKGSAEKTSPAQTATTKDPITLTEK